MTHRTTITLDDESFTFLNTIAGDNRSAYINELLKHQRENYLKQSLLKANQEESQDPDLSISVENFSGISINIFSINSYYIVLYE